MQPEYVRITIGDRRNFTALPVRPSDAITLSYSTSTVCPIPLTPAAGDRSWQLGEPILEPQAAYRLADGQLVLNWECP